MGPQLPNEPRRGNPVEASLIAQLIRYVRAITPRSSAGCQVSTSFNGTTFAPSVRRGVETDEPDGAPFDIALDLRAGDLYATFRPGTINQLLPDNYLAGVLVPASGTKYLVLNCTASNGEITGATFTADDDPPPALQPFAGQPPTAFELLIGLVVDGESLKIWGDGNIQALGVEMFRLQKLAPVAGELPYDVYYSWDIRLL